MGAPGTTPGPWEWRPYSDGGAGLQYVLVGQPVYPGSSVMQSLDIAYGGRDAAQFAASPDLYDALEELLRRFEGHSPADRSAAKNARAALAKARGEA